MVPSQLYTGYVTLDKLLCLSEPGLLYKTQLIAFEWLLWFGYFLSVSLEGSVLEAGCPVWQP